jgi:hypothetical protein
MECIQILVSLAHPYKDLFLPGITITTTSSKFSSCGLPAWATLTATLESRERMTPRGCKAVPGSSQGWVYLTEEIRREASIPRGRCLRRKGPASGNWLGAAPMTAAGSLSQLPAVTRCPCQAGSLLFSFPGMRVRSQQGDSSAVLPSRDGA